MGQKANPNGLRLGIVRDWDCSWYAERDYGELIFEDYKIRNFLITELSKAGVARVIIHRKAGLLKAIVYAARVGILFGKKGPDMDVIKAELKKLINKDVQIQVNEEKNPDLNSKLIGEWVAQQLEKRIPFRRAMKMAVQRTMKSGALGIKIACAGRLGGVEIARTEWYREGKVPLHTLRADIDYAFSEALTTYGKIGVKVWIYKQDIIGKRFNYQNVEHEDKPKARTNKKG